MHTQKNDQIMFAFYRWDAKIKSCKEQDLFDICAYPAAFEFGF